LASNRRFNANVRTAAADDACDFSNSSSIAIWVLNALLSS
jgi:hypothetical protein